MKEVQEKLLPGELGVSPRISLVISPKNGGPKGGMNRAQCLQNRPGTSFTHTKAWTGGRVYALEGNVCHGSEDAADR